MTQTFKSTCLYALLLCASLLVTGCATSPDNLKEPAQLTCIDLKEPLSATGHYGLLGVGYTQRLERGPYWSEKTDDKGTFFRGPPGGVSMATEAGKTLSAFTADGGFYVPNNPAEPVTIYKYFSMAGVPTQVPPPEASCAHVVFSKDPATEKVSLMSFAAEGAAGGAVGGLVARGISSGSGMSYGQAAGAGAVGGLAGGLIVAAIINADVGKIIHGLEIQDPKFIETLRGLAVTQVPVKEVPPRPVTAVDLQ